MKKGLLLCMLCLLVGTAFAQDTTGIVQTNLKKKPKFVFGGDGIFLADSAWRVGGFAGFSISQTALYQWAPGGSNNFSFLLTAGVFANYKKGKSIWDNSFDCKWGMVANGLIRNKALAQSNLQKNIDILALKTMYGYQIKNTLYAAAKLNFESQFSPSYDYSLTDTSGGEFRRYNISKFAAPAVLTIGPGLTWKPKEYFTMFFSPVEGKMTFVTPDSPGRDTTTDGDGRLTDAYFTDIDETRYGLKRGDWFMGELGWELDLLFQKDIVKNVNWKSHLNIFGAYLNASYNTVLPTYYSNEDSLGFISAKESNKYIPTVRWDNDIIFKVNSWLSASLSVRMVYQYNALTPVDKRKNETGAKGPDGITDKDKFGNTISAYNRLQIFEQFGIGLMAKF